MAVTIASYEIDKLKTLPLLFQTGYLTIKSTEINRDRLIALYHFGKQFEEKSLLLQ